MEYHQRKTIRLKNFDYNSPGVYFITICTKDKQKLLGSITDRGPVEPPHMILSHYGLAAEKQLKTMSDFYDDIKLIKYVIMPNHIHLLLYIPETGYISPNVSKAANSKVANFIGTFKRFCTKTCGDNIWQSRSNDHVVRNEKDYQRIWTYIENNPINWNKDCFFVE